MIYLLTLFPFKLIRNESLKQIITKQNKPAITEKARTYTECADKEQKSTDFQQVMNDENQNVKPSEVIKIFKNT